MVTELGLGSSHSRLPISHWDSRSEEVPVTELFFCLVMRPLNVTGLKSMCPTLQKAKAQHARVRGKERFID